VIWLEGHELGVVLNQTMGLQLGEDLCDNMEDWPGHTIHVFTERARNPRTGKLGPAVRVRGVDTADEENDIDDDLDNEDDSELD